MSGITQIFLGIIIVGIIMTMKVIMDGFQAVTVLNDKITALRASTKNCQMQLTVQEEENKELEGSLQELKGEVEKLVTDEKNMSQEIKTLRADLDGHKTDM